MSLCEIPKRRVAVNKYNLHSGFLPEKKVFNSMDVDATEVRYFLPTVIVSHACLSSFSLRTSST